MTQSPRRNIFIDKTENPYYSLTQIFTHKPTVPKTQIYRSSSLSEKLKLEKEEMGENGGCSVEKRKFQKFKIFSNRDELKSSNKNEFECGPAEISEKISNLSNQNTFVNEHHENYEKKTLSRTKMSKEGKMFSEVTKEKEYVLFSGFRSPVQSLGQIVDLDNDECGDKKKRKSSFCQIKFTRKVEVHNKGDSSKEKTNVKISDLVIKRERKAKSEVDSECKEFQIDEKYCCEITCPPSNQNSYFYENLQHKSDESVKENDFYSTPDDLLETKSIEKACSIEENITNVNSETLLAWNLKRITENSIDELDSRAHCLENKSKVENHEEIWIREGVKIECKGCLLQKRKMNESCSVLRKKMKEIDELLVKLVDYVCEQKQIMIWNMNNFSEKLFERMDYFENEKVSELYLLNAKLKSENEKQELAIQQLNHELSKTLLTKIHLTTKDFENISHSLDKNNIQDIGKIVKKSPRSSNSTDFKEQPKFEDANQIRQRIEFHRLNLESENESCDFFSTSPATTTINSSRLTAANRNSRMKNRVQSSLQSNNPVCVSNGKNENLEDRYESGVKEKWWAKEERKEEMENRVSNSKEKFGKIIPNPKFSLK